MRRSALAGLVLVVAVAACGKEGGFPREALPLRAAPASVNVAALIEGSWPTSSLAGDSVWTGTEVDLRDGVAEERSIFQGMGEPPRRTTIGHGRYTVFGDHELQIEMSGANAWRERFTFSYRTHYLLPPKPAGVHLLQDVYLAAPAANTFARRWWRATKKGVEGFDAELSFSPGVDALLKQPQACTVRFSIHASAGGRSGAEAHTFKCHVGAPHASGLVEIVIDGALASLVEYAVDRELYVDPAHPEVVIRGVAVTVAPMLWRR